MAKQKHVNVLIDAELRAHVDAAAQRHGITTSAVVREALRQFFAAGASSIDNGWREGYAAAVSALKRRVETAIAQVSPILPDRDRDGS